MLSMLDEAILMIVLSGKRCFDWMLGCIFLSRSAKFYENNGLTPSARRQKKG